MYCTDAASIIVQFFFGGIIIFTCVVWMPNWLFLLYYLVTGIYVFMLMSCYIHLKVLCHLCHNYGEYILLMLDVFVLYHNFLLGISVAYSAPTRHGCLKVVENNYCASRRGTFLSVNDFSTIVLFLASMFIRLWAFYGLKIYWNIFVSLDNLQVAFAVYPYWILSLLSSLVFLPCFLVQVSWHSWATALHLCFGAMKLHHGDWLFYMVVLPSSWGERQLWFLMRGALVVGI